MNPAPQERDLGLTRRYTMKRDWPKMKLVASGLAMGTTVSSMASLLQGDYAIQGKPPKGDCKPAQAADFASGPANSVGNHF